jgi:hypothetical protein
MTWIRIDDTFPSHPKVIAAGPRAAWLYVCALCYANRHLTDGWLPASILPVLAPGVRQPKILANTLVSVGLWEARNGGWQVHDYTVHQRTAEQINGVRQADRDRKKRKHADTNSGGIPAGFRADSDGTPAGFRSLEEKREESPPVVPPKGGRTRDRIRWEQDVRTYAARHFPQLEPRAGQRAVEQAIRYGHATTLADVQAFVRRHFPELEVEPA